MNKITILALFLFLSGCATTDKPILDLSSFYIITIDGQGEYLLPSNKLSSSEMLEQLPLLVAESGKSRVLLGPDVKVSQLLNIHESLRDKSIPIYYLNDSNRIINICSLQITMHPEDSKEPIHFCEYVY